MAESLLDIEHSKFTYILIPADINDDVREITFEGKEGLFQQSMKNHFSQTSHLLDDEAWTNAVKAHSSGKDMDSETLSMVKAAASTTYQIIPLTLPTKQNEFKAVNAYIDDVGRLKGACNNSRATRICTDDIRGDCFISCTFDNDEDFKRIDFTKKDFEHMLSTPPPKHGRWDPSAALANLQGRGDVALQGMIDAAAATQADKSKCANCQKQKSENVKLLLCGRCRKVRCDHATARGRRFLPHAYNCVFLCR